MILSSDLLTGNVDVLYANFILSLLEDNQYNALLTKDLISEFKDEDYDYDSLMGGKATDEFYDNSDYFSVYHKLNAVEKELSRHLRNHPWSDPEHLMNKDVNFSSVLPSYTDAILLWRLHDNRIQIAIELSFESWCLLKKLCALHQPIWEKSLPDYFS